MSAVSIPQIQERIGDIAMRLQRDPHEKDWCLAQLARCYAALEPMRPITDEVWVTKDGRHLPVSEMQEDHVRNALRMGLRIARNRREREEAAAKARAAEAKREAERAAMANAKLLAEITADRKRAKRRKK